ncbi:hypothetical protein EP227_01020 [bacterium]|nr:MAG: hypothetical protein EP227_01020 [bacterium]
MEAGEVFLTIAKISVAFAGFSGMLTALRQRSDNMWNRGDILRFWQMIEVSLSASFGSSAWPAFCSGGC